MSKGKSGNSATTGFRYYFAVLAGICRGPVDEIFLIKSGDNILWDGSQQAAQPVTVNDPDPAQPDDDSDGSYVGGPVTDNAMLSLYQPDLYGGDEREGGVQGYLWVYMGAKTQLLAAAAWIRTAMDGLMLPAMRGVVTTFFDGEVTANNPYPKAWRYRVRRALKGWDGDVWYPAKAIIPLTDPGVPAYVRGVADTSSTVTTVIYSPGPIDSTGASTGSGEQTNIQSTYSGATVTTFNAFGGISTTYSVPLEYNVIKAMNPAHIIFETCTNRDWGRGLDPALLDHASFAAAADQLYSEGFGLCIKWSRTEDVDVFLQTVIDHIGAALYTDRITGLLSLRLIRSDYDPASLSIFDYNTGLLEVTSVDTAATDTNPNEVIVKYYSPVLDAPKEARQQNLASINQLGCVFSVSKDYSGIPTSDLAIRVAARDLRILSYAWKKVQFTVDRRGYRITPGDCLIVNAPEKGLNDIVLRVGTVEDTVMTDGTIKIIAVQDAFGLPSTGLSDPQPSEWLMVDNTPRAISDQFAIEATYYDVYRALLTQPATFADLAEDKYIGFQALLATRPTPSAINYKIWESKVIHFSSMMTPFEFTGVGNFARSASLLHAIGTTDTVIPITSGLDPRVVKLPQTMLLIGDGTNYNRYAMQELISVINIIRDVTTGQLSIVARRGCVDTVGIPHPAGARLFNHSEAATIDITEYTFNDIAVSALITHTSRGDLQIPAAGFLALPLTYCNMGARMGKPYPGADFRINGYARDLMPRVDPAVVTTLDMAWKHRNKVTQGDKAIGEDEPSITPPGTIVYSFFFYSLDNGSYYAGPADTSGLTASVATATLVGAGLGNSRVRCTFTTRDTAMPLWAQAAWTQATVDFILGTLPVIDPTTTGFNTHFDQTGADL